MIFKALLLGVLTVTSYRSVPEQTDDTPFITSIGEHVHVGGIAVSQDLLKSGVVEYHDILYVEGFGFYQVNDTMNHRHVKHVDIWVETLAEEKIVGVQYHKVYLMKGPKHV